ncbi:17-beta-hydroxysteroid dehydrogenase type 3 isoform X1 [Paramisgurnus dabryanus]|uniref:17-beta-hydroxysteroid dehydrogenase type 3 isoform X1 n=1 Tax=Paramisgurnus dabryanus TaxID=90735 RepID=UPI003CCFC8DA
MTLTEIILILAGTCTVMLFGVKLICFVMVLAPKLCYPLPESFMTSLGKWAVITGGSDGIGRAYAQELSKYGLNVVIISRNQEKLDRAARTIELATGVQVKVIAADFTKDNIYGHIMERIEGLDIGILVNNVGILPNQIPCRLLETAGLEERIYDVINCNVKAMVKHLTGLRESIGLLKCSALWFAFRCAVLCYQECRKGRGAVLNVSSGIAKIPFPLYTLYAASKVFVERFSQGLQAEYRSKGIIIQTVAPFGVSTSMTLYQKPDLVTFTAEDFVRSSLKYLRAGDQTYGSITHTILGWILQAIPTWVLRSKAFQHNFEEYVKEQIGR